MQKFAAAPADEFQFLLVRVDRQVKLHFHSVDGDDDSISLLILSIPLSSFIYYVLQIALRVTHFLSSFCDHRVSHGIDNLFCLRKYNGEMYFIFDESRGLVST